MLGLAAEALAIAALTAVAAGFVRGLAGFGLSVVLVPVLALAIAPIEAVLVGNISLFLIGLTDISRIRADAEKSALPITVIAVVCAPLGLWALTALDPDLARVLIALVSLGAFVLVVVPLGKLTIARYPALAISGFATGFFAGFAGMPGPGMAPFYLRGRLEPRVARASMMAVFLALTPIAALLAILSGVGSWREPLLACSLFPAVLAGDWLGHHTFGRITTRQWQSAVAVVLAIAALAALWKLLA